jgi:hypothetical protein
VPWAGYLYGAAMSWSPKASVDMDIAAALSLHAFHDASGDTGRIAFDMGNAYQVNGAKSRNGTLLQQLYLLPIENDWPMHRVSPGGFEATQERLAEWSAALDPARICRTDAGLVVEELRNGAALAAAGAMIGAAKYARENGAPAAKVRAGFRAAAKRIDTLIPEYERLWLARNRPGGLPDSVAVLRSTVVALREAAS